MKTLFTGLFCFAALACSEPKDETITLVLLPDTQIYSERHPDIFRSQTEWIVQHADSIDFVLHQGDITNRNTDEQWEVAAGAMALLDDQVPYAVCVGNHDIGTNGSTDVRNTDLFNKWFPYEKYQSLPAFGGAFEAGKMDNTWYTFNAGAKDWLVLSLEFGPRNNVLDWANDVVAQHPDHKVIVNTHAYMYSDETRMSPTRNHNWLPEHYGVGKDTAGNAVNNGEQIWDKFVSQHPNIVFVFSGHVLNDGVGTLVGEGVHGNRVYQMLANYQSGVEGSENGGNGFLRMVKIDPRKRTIAIKTYSPYLDAYNRDAHQEFVFEGVDL